MTDYHIQPFVGIGPVRLGMSRDVVRRSMLGPMDTFKKASSSEYETDAFHGSAFQISYGGDQPIVEFIELSRGSSFRAFYNDLDVFATPALAVVALFGRTSSYDAENPEIPYAYLFRGLQLSLWRPVAPGSDSDEEGRYFSTVGIGRAGYFDVA